MKTVLVNTQAPFARGGAEYLVQSLAFKLREQGIDVAIVNIPFKWHPPESILRHMVACRLLRVDALQPDLMIGHKFPSYYIPFKNKKLWLFHQFRQAYDLWGTSFQDLPSSPEGHRIREMIVASDNKYLREANEIYTNSRTVAGRLQRFNQILATAVLYPPVLHPESFKCDGYGDFFFYPSRITPSKRQHIAIEAMRHVKSDFRLILAGNEEDLEYSSKLRDLIKTHNLEDRVRFLGWVTEDEKLRLLASARAVIYLPYDEDSYGFVTLEAFHSSKAVLTFTDSGGTEELIEHGLNGLVLEPSATALAQGMEKLIEDRSLAKRLGASGLETIAERDITWKNVLDHLLS